MREEERGGEKRREGSEGVGVRRRDVGEGGEEKRREG